METLKQVDEELYARIVKADGAMMRTNRRSDIPALYARLEALREARDLIQPLLHGDAEWQTR